MKQKLRLLKTGMICCALAFLSCHDDLPDQIGNDTHGHSRHTYLDFKTFSQQFPETASKVRSQNDKAKNHLQRGVYDPENDFTIETDKIFMGENEGGSYITFKVSKEGDPDGLDNLVLKINSENEVTPLLLHYDLTEQEKAGLLNKEFIENIGSKMSFEILDGTVLNTSNTTNKMECSTFVIAECLGNLKHPNGIDENGNRCPGYSESTVTTCSGSGSGGGPPNIPTPPVSTPNTGNNPGQSGGGGGNPGTGTYNPNLPVITTPIFEDTPQINPCTKINFLNNDAVFLQKIETLKSAASQWNFEKLYTIYDDPTPNSDSGQTDNYDYEEFQGSQFQPTATYTGNTSMKGIIHSHTDDLLSIFSPQDLRDFYNLINNPLITEDFFYGVVNSDGVAYVLQLSNRQEFINFGNKYLSSDSKFAVFETETYYKKFGVRLENSSTLNENNFLKMLSNLTFGITIARKESGSSEFKKLTYLNNQVVPATCN